MARVFRFIKALFKFILKGKHVPFSTEIKRRGVCKDCEFRKEGICSLCGCNTNLKTKWSSEECPDNRW